MPAPPAPRTPPPGPDDDALLDEALDETFPASDPVQPSRHEKLPPADAPGSDVANR
jgi:hypothetical protein